MLFCRFFVFFGLYSFSTVIWIAQTPFIINKLGCKLDASVLEFGIFSVGVVLIYYLHKNVLIYRALLSIILSFVILSILPTLETSSDLIYNMSVILCILSLFVPLCIIFLRCVGIIVHPDASIDRRIGTMVENDQIEDIMDLEMFGFNVDDATFIRARYNVDEKIHNNNDYNNNNSGIVNDVGFQHDLKEQKDAHGNFLIEHEVKIDGYSTSYGDTVWLRAAKKGKFERMKYCLKKGTNINERDMASGETALIISVPNCSRSRGVNTDHDNVLRKQSVKILTWLLQHGADVNVKDKLGYTALFHAVNANVDIKVLTMLLNGWSNNRVNCVNDVNNDVNMRQGSTGKTLLMIAIENQNIGVIRLLLDHPNVELQVRDNSGETEWVYCWKTNNYEIIKMYIECIKRNEQLQIQQQQWNVNETNNMGCNALIHICESKNILSSSIKIAKLLLENGIDINAREQHYDGEQQLGMTALLKLCSINKLKHSSEERKYVSNLIELLLNDKRIDVNMTDNYGNSPWMYVTCWNYNLPAICYFLNYYDRIRDELNNNINNNINVARFDINEPNPNQSYSGATVLIYYTKYCRDETDNPVQDAAIMKQFEELLNYGGDRWNINAKDGFSGTALVYAVKNRNEKFVKLLFDNYCKQLNLFDSCMTHDHYSDQSVWTDLINCHKSDNEGIRNYYNQNNSGFDMKMVNMLNIVINAISQAAAFGIDCNLGAKQLSGYYLGQTSRTPLLWAMNNGEYDLLQLFLANGNAFNHLQPGRNDKYNHTIWEYATGIPNPYNNKEQYEQYSEYARNSYEYAKKYDNNPKKVDIFDVNLNVDIVEMLIKKGVNINRKDVFGTQAWFRLLCNNDDVKSEKILRLLLNNGMNVNNVDKDQLQALKVTRFYDKQNRALELLLSL